MCGSSAAKSYGSLGSSCAMHPPRRSNEEGIVHQNGGWEFLSDRQHAIEGDLRPVLLLVGHDDAIVDAPFDQLFENPEQMVRRDAEHRRAEAAELIERDDGTPGCDFL